MPGKLLLVATPIGNLDDLSPRAIAAFRDADLVACEDTRHTGLLLHRLNLKKPLASLHEHNERARLPQLLARLEAGETIAVASDAGTPLLSDPGYVLTRAAIEAGHRVEAVPGPAAPLAALVVSGLPPYPFTFAGFAPPKSGKRRSFFERLGALGHTFVVFESPHRLLASLDDAIAVIGDRSAAVARELTKAHEEVLRGPLSTLRAELGGRERLLGEFVLVVAGEPPPAGRPDAAPLRD